MVDPVEHDGCSCASFGVMGLDALLTLLAHGVPQWEASRLLWGTPVVGRPSGPTRWDD